MSGRGNGPVYSPIQVVWLLLIWADCRGERERERERVLL